MGQQDDCRIELFVFPDGTQIEMLVFDRPARRSRKPAALRTTGAARQEPVPAPSATAEAPPLVAGPEARRCPLCHSELVYPVDWRRDGDAAWVLDLRCPNCEMQRVVAMGREGVEEFNRALYHGAQALAREAESLTRRNFEEEAEKIVAALERGLIQPMDF